MADFFPLFTNGVEQNLELTGDFSVIIAFPFNKFYNDTASHTPLIHSVDLKGAFKTHTQLCVPSCCLKQAFISSE
jgi:hypothetical protein